MKFIKLLRNVLLLFCMWYFWPSYNGGVFRFLIKIFAYLLLIYLCNAIINDTFNWIEKNWKGVYLKWIDEREHIKGNTLAKVTRMDFIGALFRIIHFVKHNRKSIAQAMWYNFKDNLAIYLTFILGSLIIIGFIFISRWYYLQ